MRNPRTLSVPRWAFPLFVLFLLAGLCFMATSPASAGDAAQAPANPPVPGQAGTCIVGRVIDLYDQPVGTGWEVSAKEANGGTKTTTVNSKGEFQFDKLTGGVWTVALTVPDGWQAVTSLSIQVPLNGNGKDPCAQIRFKVRRPANLEVVKKDQFGMTPLPGWEFTITNGTDKFACTTNWQGKCRFPDLFPGIWTVEEATQFGWELVSPVTNPDTITLVSPRAANVWQTMIFINKQVHDGTIIVNKRDAFDNPLAGWKMVLTRDDGTQAPQTKSTNTSGTATFSGLQLGAWTVTEQVLPDWLPQGAISQTVELTQPGAQESITFVNAAAVCIMGQKINQLDQGLSGWTITLSSSDSQDSRNTVTGVNGTFSFRNVPAGKWVISEEIPEGWEAVTPSEIELDLQQPLVPGACERIRFKNKTDFAILDVFKRDALDGVGLPDWPITVTAAYGGAPLAGKTDGTGHIRFTGLTPGTYIVEEGTMDGWVAVGNTSVKVVLQATGSSTVVTFRNRQEGRVVKHPPYRGGKDDEEDGCCYVVRSGDTLSGLAVRNHTSVSAIMKNNNLGSTLIRIGQKLCIP
jgi:hypothetical protein